MGNASYGTTDGSIDGPLRCGIFATGTSTRAEAGATYYGVMEMGGNLCERSVTVGNSSGRAFAGTHGDGALSANGHADIADWPGYDGLESEVINATGSGYLGGHFGDNTFGIRISDRYFAARTSSSRESYLGFRAVRTP